jgi:hypothetical protein
MQDDIALLAITNVYSKTIHVVWDVMLFGCAIICTHFKGLQYLQI